MFSSHGGLLTNAMYHHAVVTKIPFVDLLVLVPCWLVSFLTYRPFGVLYTVPLVFLLVCVPCWFLCFSSGLNSICIKRFIFSETV